MLFKLQKMQLHLLAIRVQQLKTYNNQARLEDIDIHLLQTEDSRVHELEAELEEARWQLQCEQCNTAKLLTTWRRELANSAHDLIESVVEEFRLRAPIEVNSQDEGWTSWPSIQSVGYSDAYESGEEETWYEVADLPPSLRQ